MVKVTIMYPYYYPEKSNIFHRITYSHLLDTLQTYGDYIIFEYPSLKIKESGYFTNIEKLITKTPIVLSYDLNSDLLLLMGNDVVKPENIKEVQFGKFGLSQVSVDIDGNTTNFYSINELTHTDIQKLATQYHKYTVKYVSEVIYYFIKDFIQTLKNNGFPVDFSLRNIAIKLLSEILSHYNVELPPETNETAKTRLPMRSLVDTDTLIITEGYSEQAEKIREAFYEDTEILTAKRITLFDIYGLSLKILLDHEFPVFSKDGKKVSLPLFREIAQKLSKLKGEHKTYNIKYVISKYIPIYLVTAPLQTSVEYVKDEKLVKALTFSPIVTETDIASLSTLEATLGIRVGNKRYAVSENTEKENPFKWVYVNYAHDYIMKKIEELDGKHLYYLGDGVLAIDSSRKTTRKIGEWVTEIDNADFAFVSKYNFLMFKKATTLPKGDFTNGTIDGSFCEKGYPPRNFKIINGELYEVLPIYNNYCIGQIFKKPLLVED